MSTGIVFALQALSMCTRSTAVSADITKAVFLAKDKLQELEFLEKEGKIAQIEPEAQGEYKNYRWSYQIKPDEDLSLYLLDFKINWQRQNRVEELSVRTYLR